MDLNGRAIFGHVRRADAIREAHLNITRRNVAIGGLSFLAGTSLSTMSRAEFGEGLRDLGEGIEDFAIAQDAYILRLSARDHGDDPQGHDQRGRAEGTRGADGPIHQGARISRRQLPRRDRAERRHALHDGMGRCRQGALGPEHPRHEGPLFPVSDARTAGPTCFRFRASAPPARARRPTRSPGRAGTGTLPAGVKEYKSPTSLVWILGRIYCTGTPEDYAAVHAAAGRNASSCR